MKLPSYKIPVRLSMTSNLDLTLTTSYTISALYFKRNHSLWLKHKGFLEYILKTQRTYYVFLLSGN
jgi:hypothetical protein